MTELKEPPVYSPVSTEEPPVSSSNNNNNNEDLPPGYFDLFRQIKQAKQEAKNPLDLTQKSIAILCQSVLFTILLGICSILPIASLTIGLLSREKCTINPKIPLWLIISGIAGIATLVIRFFSNLIAQLRNRKGGQSNEPTVLTCFINLLSLFLFVWFIIGNFWVYSIVKTVQYDEVYYPKDYCDKLCYLFSFWYITASWILIALSCVCCCATLCCVVGIGAFLGLQK